MVKLSLKEKFAFRFILREKIYQRWYGRFLLFRIDYLRLKRVVARISNWLQWCDEWAKEGDEVYKKADYVLDLS